MKKKPKKARDIRLYRYTSGSLVTVGTKTGRLHTHTSISSCIKTIEALQKDSPESNYVMVEVFGSYRSRILYVSNLKLGDIL